jgi:tRNA threonylcarbamoyl adenosine modification protein YeaZ
VLLLAFDTSTPVVSVAVAGTTLLAEHADEANNRHGEVLAALIARVLADAGARPADVGRICVGVGPGPYTGLRVGVVTALSLGDALGVPVAGVCSLDAVAAWAGRPAAERTFTVFTDARRREVFWARYQNGKRIEGPAVDAPAVVADRLPPGETVVGAGAVQYAHVFDRQVVDADEPFPRAAAIAELSRDPGNVVADVRPIYLRRPDARPPAAPKRVTPA